ncbi:MAG TPA: hypothetical protein VK524_08110 [Polyangiaceae bacterium]|nr:hypothetical protein [Polyangiaceae bacterium]
MQSRYCLFSAGLIGLGVAAGMAACGGSQAAPETPAEPIATVSPPVAPPETTGEPSADVGATDAGAGPAKVKFDDLSKDQQKAYMKDVVLPKMKETFLSLNAKRYADMNCMTCHGPDAKKGKFEMPNPKLPKLDPKDNFKAHAKEAEVVKFMAERVVPEMAALLGEEPYDPAKQEGFGCFDCHVKK